MPRDGGGFTRSVRQCEIREEKGSGIPGIVTCCPGPQSGCLGFVASRASMSDQSTTSFRTGLHCNTRNCSQAASKCPGAECREAYGVRGACSRFGTVIGRAKAPASWTHSIRFAQFGCGLTALRVYVGPAGKGQTKRTESLTGLTVTLDHPTRGFAPNASEITVRS